MKKNAKNRNNSVDAQDGEDGYAVLTKTGRIQVLVQPTAKQLRRRGRRGWHLYGSVHTNNHAGKTLIGTIQRALREMQGTKPVSRKRKNKSSKSGSKR
jgi:hypothetical protein